MGLRINTHLPSLTALKHLRDIDAEQSKVFDRLATGHQIGRSSDNPTVVSIADQMRAQIQSLQQLVENAENATNLLSTADAGMAEVGELLTQIQRSLVFAANGGGASEVLAEQDFVDGALESVRRIAGHARFGDISLLNGDSGFDVVSADPVGILAVRPFRVQFNPTASATTFQISVTVSATQARIIEASTAVPGAVAASGGTVTLLLMGPKGTATIALASGATNTDLSAAVNDLRGQTGVYASAGFMFTDDAGSRRFIRLEQIGGTGNFSGGDPAAPGFVNGVGGVARVSGGDAKGTFYGKPFTGDGNTVNLTDPFFSGQILLKPAFDTNAPSASGGTFTFTIRTSGLRVEVFSPTDQLVEARIGLPALDPGTLGTPETVVAGQTFGGLLSTLETGGTNDLLTNPFAGLGISRDASRFVDSVRAFVGAVLSNEVASARRANEVAVENLTASESVLRDADFAEQSALLVRSQALFQSTLSVLGQANALPQRVLDLLSQ